MPAESPALTANQLVGYNLTRIRKALGLSQDEARALLAPYGLSLSKNVYSAAERSYDGKRVRQFTADDLVAMSLAFGVPISYFLSPPPPKDRPAGAAFYSGKERVSWRGIYDVMLDGQHSALTFHRALELPAGERPEANSAAGMALSRLSSGRVSVWDEPPGPLQPDDPRLRQAEHMGDGEG
jgi:transcriptional regulator with XRE-family HTH domain